MKKQLILRAFLFLIIPLTLWGIIYAYPSDPTHPALAKKSAEIYNKFYKNVLTQEEINWLAEGAKKEDVPPRWVNHFYDPITGLGWQGEKITFPLLLQQINTV